MIDSIEDFRVISSVYRTLSLTVSSEEFNVSPATMSKKLSSIEARLGKKLFFRSTRNFSATEEGELYYHHATEVLEKIDSFDIKNHSIVEPTGIIKLTASATFSRLYLTPVINKFLELYPKIKIELILSDQLTDIIKEGIDVAIRIAPLKDSALISKSIGNGSKVLCASREYLNKNGIPKKLSDLKQHNCLTFGNDTNWTFIKGKKEHSVKVRGNFKVNYGEMLVQSVKAGLGVSILSLWCVHDLIKSGEVVTLLDDYQLTNQPDIFIVYPDRRQLPNKTRIFIDFLSNEIDLPFY